MQLTPQMRPRRRRSVPHRHVTTGEDSKKAQRTTGAETAKQDKPQWSASNTDVRRDPTPPALRTSGRKCSRCWNSGEHSYRECSETKCACGKPLTQGQVVCFNYDAHPPTAKFKNGLPQSVSIARARVKPQLVPDQMVPQVVKRVHTSLEVKAKEAGRTLEHSWQVS